jgi:ADP-ribose pyrophosphatase YjhB (NUDIX family)
MNKIIIASGLVIAEKKKILVDKSGQDDFWKFCGGRPQENENLIETAKRRAREELGIEIEITDQEPFIFHTIKETPEGKIDVILAHFNAKRVGEIKPGADIREWKWLPMENIEKENLGPNIIPALVHFWYLDK